MGISQTFSTLAKTLAKTLAAALVVGTSSAEPTMAQVKVVENVETYNVKGTTGAEILESVRKRQFKAAGSNHAIAVTAVDIALGNIQMRPRGRHCYVEQAEIILTLDYTYPIWVDAAKGSPRLRKAWENFTAELARHETRHAEIALERSNKMHRLYSRAKTQRLTNGDCADFDKSHYDKLNRYRQAAYRKHIRFDRKDARPNAPLRRLMSVLRGAL